MNIKDYDFENYNKEEFKNFLKNVKNIDEKCYDYKGVDELSLLELCVEAANDEVFFDEESNVKWVELIESLIEAGADVNQKSAYPYSSSNMIFYVKNLEIFKILVNGGLDLNIKNHNGISILHFTKNIEMVKILVEAGSNVNDKYDFDEAEVLPEYNKCEEATKIILEKREELRNQKLNQKIKEELKEIIEAKKENKKRKM